MRKVVIKTAFKSVFFSAPETLTLEECLCMKRLPPNLFQGYVRTNSVVIPVPLNTRISSISDKSDIVLQCVRNTDLRHVLPQKSFYKRAKKPIGVISEYHFSDLGCTETVHEINTDIARATVKERVCKFLDVYSTANLIVVGISGGGDSNALAEALSDYSKSVRKSFLFYTIIFEPLWPESAAMRAAELCRRYNLNHRVYRNKEIENLLKLRGALDNMYREYSTKFKDNTNHFFGTYLISLVGRRLCRDNNTNEYILGFNREDLLADLLYSLINGQKPLAFPVRKFGKINLLMPLWEIPKLLLDACYPEYSLANYEERSEDTSTYQRDIIYFLAHRVDSAYPNLGLSIMKGIQKIFENNWPEIEHDLTTDLYISEYADDSKILEVKNFLKKYINNG
jgi:tRNA(Ile)-lysidine synthase TilS/MesJ